MKKFISFIASSALAFGLSLQQDIKSPLQNTNYQLYVNQRNNIHNSDIELVCNIVYEINQAACKNIIELGNPKFTRTETQRLKKMMKMLDKVICVARSAIEKSNMVKVHDEKVYYSSIALKSMLESAFNEKYIQLTGGFHAFNADDFDCILYGKQVDEVGKLLHG